MKKLYPHNLIVFISLTLLWSACEVKPQEIVYGQDACHFCKMTIVDKQHAAQLVTVKGKAFKYDAIECMMNHLNHWDHPPVKYFLITDYATPGKLIDATNAHYLISEAIPSPMGEFLTAFETKELRDITQEEMEGELLTWHQLQNRFNSNH